MKQYIHLKKSEISRAKRRRVLNSLSEGTFDVLLTEKKVWRYKKKSHTLTFVFKNLINSFKIFCRKKLQILCIIEYDNIISTIVGRHISCYITVMSKIC